MLQRLVRLNIDAAHKIVDSSTDVPAKDGFARDGSLRRAKAVLVPACLLGLPDSRSSEAGNFVRLQVSSESNRPAVQKTKVSSHGGKKKRKTHLFVKNLSSLK